MLARWMPWTLATAALLAAGAMEQYALQTAMAEDAARAPLEKPQAAPAEETPSSRGDGYPVVAPRADLFNNYYVPSLEGGPPAQLYISPRPTPPLVGHTYITYQPLMPHEFLYRHRRVYYRWNGGYVPANRTRVWWW